MLLCDQKNYGTHKSREYNCMCECTRLISILLLILLTVTGCTLLKIPGKTIDAVGKVAEATGKVAGAAAKTVSTTGKVAGKLLDAPGAKEAVASKVIP
jgi:hypothetical protein